MEVTFSLGAIDDNGMHSNLSIENCNPQDRCNATNGMCADPSLARVRVNDWSSNLCRQHLTAFMSLIVKALDVAGNV